MEKVGEELSSRFQEEPASQASPSSCGQGHQLHVPRMALNLILLQQNFRTILGVRFLNWRKATTEGFEGTQAQGTMSGQRKAVPWPTVAPTPPHPKQYFKMSFVLMKIQRRIQFWYLYSYPLVDELHKILCLISGFLIFSRELWISLIFI